MGDSFRTAVKKPISAWNKRLKADFRDLFRLLGKAVIDGTAGSWDELAKDIVDASVAMELRNEPEQVAWLLIFRSLAVAMARLTQEQQEFLRIGQQELERLGRPLDLTCESQELAIDRDCFQQLERLAIVGEIALAFGRWIRTLGLNAATADAIAARLPPYFNDALVEEWCQQPELYNAGLKGFNTPFSQANEQTRAWLRYGGWLQKQIEEPIFQEPFGLQQVYIWPRAYYWRKVKVADPQSPSRTLDAGEQQERVVVNLEQTLNQWLEAADATDAIRVISGGPGSGKSSFTKMFAAAQAKRRQWHVLWVPLHRFDFTDDLIDAVGTFVETTKILPHNPLAPGQDRSRLLMIFDGLEELTPQGQRVPGLVQPFVRELQQQVNQLNEPEMSVCAILSGRAQVIQAHRSEFSKPQQILHLLPYFVAASEREGRQQPFVDPENLLEVDQRQQWWQRYDRLSGGGYGGLPETLARQSLTAIAAQPLLNYLIALSCARGQLNLVEALNLNAIYADFIQGSYERGWMKVWPSSSQRMTLENFVRILEEIALATWHGDGQTTTVKAIEARCSSGGLRSSLNAFQVGAKQGITRSLNVFYFRQSNLADEEPIFELTHRSFGEYLSAKRMLREVDLLDEEWGRHQRDRGWDEIQLLQRWAVLFGPAPIDWSRLQFIRREVQLQPTARVAQWQKTLSRLIEAILHNRRSLEKLSLIFHPANPQGRNAEVALLVVLNACARATQTVAKVEWPNPEAFGHWLARLVGQPSSGGETNLAIACLSHLNLQYCCLTAQDLRHADLCQVDLRRADLSRADLSGADLSGADLSGADLSGADLSETNLHHADLSSTHLNRANLISADLSGADLINADLSSAHLIGAHLNEADLSRADLIGTNLNKAHLNEAALIGTNLIGANLNEADLSEADLSGADFSGADLSGADLSGTDLIGTDLMGTRNLTPEQVKTARGWEYTRYSADLRSALGLPPEGEESDLRSTLGLIDGEGEET